MTKQKKKRALLDRILKRFADDVCIDTVYECGKAKGFEIAWSKKGVGFGDIRIYQKNGKLFIDTETMGKVFALTIMAEVIRKAKEV